MLAAQDLGLRTVVIDAGHGGKDSGAVSKDKKSYEKNFTLSIATQLAEKIREAYPDVKVVLTRSTDKFVELRDRAAIANKAGANLFISIHINSAAGTSANGYSVHILGQSSDKNRDLFAYNRDVVQRENAVIMLEDDYSTKYADFNSMDDESNIFVQLMQNAFLEQSLSFADIVSGHLKGGPIKADRGIWQNPFYVLWKTSMPSVLVELGFISNSTDLNALREAKNRSDLAERLFQAFAEYKTQYDKSVNVKSDAESVTQSPATETAAPKQEAPLYGTQIFASSRLLEESDAMFMGYKPEIVRAGSLYKYIIGVSESEQDAREKNKDIKAKYPSSFMVRIESGTTVRIK